MLEASAVLEASVVLNPPVVLASASLASSFVIVPLVRLHATGTRVANQVITATAEREKEEGNDEPYDVVEHCGNSGLKWRQPPLPAKLFPSACSHDDRP